MLQKLTTVVLWQLLYTSLINVWQSAQDSFLHGFVLSEWI